MNRRKKKVVTATYQEVVNKGHELCALLSVSPKKRNKAALNRVREEHRKLWDAHLRQIGMERPDMSPEAIAWRQADFDTRYAEALRRERSKRDEHQEDRGRSGPGPSYKFVARNQRTG